jgi:tRNA (guanine37-N1)-methyltransferase
VLAGGELAALLVTESVVRLVGGVLGNDASVRDESFQDGLLEYPQYTRPAVFRSWEVPDVLRSGDHSKVARWRRAAAVRRTLARRPDLIEARGGLHPAERALLEEFPDTDEGHERSKGASSGDSDDAAPSGASEPSG